MAKMSLKCLLPEERQVCCLLCSHSAVVGRGRVQHLGPYFRRAPTCSYAKELSVVILFTAFGGGGCPGLDFCSPPEVGPICCLCCLTFALCCPWAAETEAAMRTTGPFQHSSGPAIPTSLCYSQPLPEKAPVIRLSWYEASYWLSSAASGDSCNTEL